MGSAVGNLCSHDQTALEESCTCFSPKDVVQNNEDISAKQPRLQYSLQEVDGGGSPDAKALSSSDFGGRITPYDVSGLDVLAVDGFIEAKKDTARCGEAPPLRPCPHAVTPKTASKPSEVDDQSRPVAEDDAASQPLDGGDAKINLMIQEAVEQTRQTETIRLETEYRQLRKTEKLEQWQSAVLETKKQLRSVASRTIPGAARAVNRYGEGELPVFEEGRHIPVLGLINPMSGAGSGADILDVARRSPYYQDRFFNIIDVVKSQNREGGLLDVFRLELNNAKDEALKLGTRPRLISGGGDGTGSFALFMIFLALKANTGRNEKAEEGLEDTGNGFIWTDKQMAESFPAIAQMPLGSANDFGNILGWGQKYPGDAGPARCCGSRAWPLKDLQRWMQALIDPKSRIVNFDVWGFMPAKGQQQCDFKLAELTGKRGCCPKQNGNILLKEAGKPVPFFVALYFSCGFGAYMTARFQINRRRTPLANRMEYVRQAVGIIVERTPPQMQTRLDNVNIESDAGQYFPPRKRRGRGYREVGFYNINWQANALHGYDRAGMSTRLNPCNSRKPVMFNDGAIDLFRWKFKSILKNPGLKVQTDKRKEVHLSYDGGKGKGIFFQWDGEARFAFSPNDQPFNIFIRKVLSIPVVLGPSLDESLTGPVDNGCEVKFQMYGETESERDLVRRRIQQLVKGDLDSELIATESEIRAANFVYPEEEENNNRE